MKINQQITRFILGTIFIPFLFFMLTVGFISNQLFQSYIEKNTDQKIEEFEYAASQMILQNTGKRDLDHFFSYYNDLEAEVELYDTQGQLIYFYSYPQAHEKEVNLERETLLYLNNKVIGQLQFTYFQKELSGPAVNTLKQGLFILLLISIPFIILLSRMLSRSFKTALARPLDDLIYNTEKIQEGKYDEMKIVDNHLREFQNLDRDLRSLAKSLELQENLRKSYAQDIAHELRTPVTHLQLTLEAIHDGVLEMSDERISHLLSEIHHLNQLIEDLKKSFDDQTENLVLEEEVFILNFFLDDLVRRYNSHFEKEKINLKLPDETISVKMDRKKLEMILGNLLTNAMKAVDHLENPIVDVLFHCTREKLLITVADNGSGISEEDQKYLFNRFFRADTARNRKVGGSGLGLAITKNLADLMNIKIIVHSKLNLGSHFILEMDRKELEDFT